jgi:hypothetical protein
MSGAVVPSLLIAGRSIRQGGDTMEKMTLGVDVACRAAHQASLADRQGNLVWSGRTLLRRPTHRLRWSEPLGLSQAVGMLSKSIWRHSHGHHGEDQAIPLLEAAAETLRLGDDSERPLAVDRHWLAGWRQRLDCDKPFRRGQPPLASIFGAVALDQ